MRKKTSSVTKPFSVRLPLDLIAELQQMAAVCGYSANQFCEQGLAGICDMIHDTANPPRLPKIVAVSRFMIAQEGGNH